MKKIFILIVFISTMLSIDAADTNVFYVTDNGFLIWQKRNGQIVMNPQQVEKAKKSRESLPSSEFPEGNWGIPTNGFQLSLKFDKQIFTNGEPIIAVMLMRNVTNISQTYFTPIQIVGMNNLDILQPKNESEIEIVTRPPIETLYPLTQRRYQDDITKMYDLTNGSYTFQAICYRPIVKSQEVHVKIGQ